MLIATILSQNTNDKNSHRAFLSLREKMPTWEGVASAPLGRLKSAIRVGGMANQKGPRIRNVLRRIRQKYGRYDLSALRRKGDEEVIRELTSLDGVGVKTAACVLLFSLGRDVFPVDTHVHRICSRLGLVPGSRSPEQTFRMMQALIPSGRAYTLHTNMIRFGRKICRASNPACGICPLFAECLFPGKSAARRPAFRSKADHDFMLLDNVGV
jgi:endonuclease-3